MTSRTGIPLSVCDSCGAGFFPTRLMCARCGGRRFRECLVDRGAVEETTTVRRRVGASPDPAVLATVRLPGGQRIIAGLTASVAPGTQVALEHCGGAVFARTGQP